MEKLTYTLILAPIMVLSLLLAIPAQGAITRNSTTYTKCSANPCTVPHTVAGADPFLAVCVTWWHYLASPAITSATWNGLPLTAKDTVMNIACGGGCLAALYIMNNPSTATADVSIGWSGTWNDAIVGVASFNGVDSTTPTGAAVSNTGSGSPAAVTVSSNSGEVVMDCLTSIAAGPVPSLASGQTLNWSDIGGGGFIHSSSSYISGVPSTVSAWTISGAPTWALLGMPIKPVGGTGGGGSTPGTQRVISWTDNSANETCFHLQWQTDQSFPNWVDINACLPPNTVSVAHNIGTSTGDCYRIEATNSGGSNGFTAPTCAAAAPPPPPPPPPPSSAIPTALQFDFEEDLL